MNANTQAFDVQSHQLLDTLSWDERYSISHQLTAEAKQRSLPLASTEEQDTFSQIQSEQESLNLFE